MPRHSDSRNPASTNPWNRTIAGLTWKAPTRPAGQPYRGSSSIWLHREGREQTTPVSFPAVVFVVPIGIPLKVSISWMAHSEGTFSVLLRSVSLARMSSSFPRGPAAVPSPLRPIAWRRTSTGTPYWSAIEHMIEASRAANATSVPTLGPLRKTSASRASAKRPSDARNRKSHRARTVASRSLDG